MEQSTAVNTNSGQKPNNGGIISSNNTTSSKISKSQISKAMIKPGTSAGTSGEGARGGIRGQLLINDSNNESRGPNQEPLSSDNIQERIKIGQEINNNRPKESKGQRSTEKRHINNQSLGVTSASGAGGIHPIPMHTTHIKRTALNVQSPLAGGSQSTNNQNLIGMHGAQNVKGKQNMTELFSQTSKFSRGGIRGAVGSEALQ